KICNGDHASWAGKFYRFHDVGLKPKYPSMLAIWYAGATPAAVRRAVEYCDGWLPGRITVATYRKRVEKLRSSAAAQGRPRLHEGCIPITSIDKDRKTAIEKVNLEGLLSNANKQKLWVKPASPRISACSRRRAASRASPSLSLSVCLAQLTKSATR